MKWRFDTFVEKGEVLSHSGCMTQTALSCMPHRDIDFVLAFVPVMKRRVADRCILVPRKYTHILQLIGKLRQAPFLYRCL